MRKRIGMVLLLGCVAAQLGAQPATYEVYAGLGFLTAPDLLDLAGSAFDEAGAATGEDRFVSTSGFVGPVIAGLNFYVNPNWTVGVAGLYNTYDKQVRLRETSTPIGEYTDKYLTLLVRVKYRYYRGEVVQLYAGLSAGPSFYNQQGQVAGQAGEEDATYAAYQATLFGLRIGRTFAGFMELGFGYTGLLSLGVSFQP